MENTMNLMATSRQLFALWLASGQAHDYRNDKLTKEQASKMLDEFNNKSGYQKTTKNVTAKKKESHKRIAKVVMNKFGIKVGDLFRETYGYEETHNDFFQVVALVGESSVRVRYVEPKLIKATPTCSMAEDRVFAIPQNGEMLDYPKEYWRIKDQEKGDLKKINDTYGCPVFKMGSSYAKLCKGESIKVYESWYA